MSTPILLPKLGFSMTEGALAEWRAADGEEVTTGQIIYALESEKSVSDVESPSSGRLKIIAAAGQIYPVGTLLGEII